jgi:arylsulfatase A-like enzyme
MEYMAASTAATTLGQWPQNAQAQTQKPNIVYILSDDQGWGDVGYHGSDIQTPNIDRLVASGTRLSQFYVQPICSPTRASFMTGRYTIRYGLQRPITPWSRFGLPLEERTLAQGLKEAGYKTAVCGKWHLGFYTEGHLPTNRGFDHHYGHYNGTLDYYSHNHRGGLDWHRNEETVKEEGYSTDLITSEAVQLINEQDTFQPLFLYVAYNAPHTPMQAPEEYLQRYAQIEDKNRRTYAAMVSCMDDGIGRIIDALKQNGMDQNTLLIFSSDNGGARSNGSSNKPLRQVKGTVYEGGVRVPAVAVWPGMLKAGSVVDELIHITDLYPTFMNLAGGSLEQPLPLDGLNVWETISKGKPTPREHLLHEWSNSGGALRQGNWKVVVTIQNNDEKRTEKTELFNIAEDPNEKADLSAKNPDQLKILSHRLTDYRQQAVPQKQAGPLPKDFKVPKVWGPWA